MADFLEIIDDINPFDDLSKGDKKTIFAVLCVGAGVLGLAGYLVSRNKQDVVTGYVASGYSDMGGTGTGSNDGYYQSLISEMEEEYAATAKEQQEYYENIIDEMQDDFTASSKEQEEFYTTLVDEMEKSFETTMADKEKEYNSTMDALMDSMETLEAQWQKQYNDGMSQLQSQYNQNIQSIYNQMQELEDSKNAEISKVQSELKYAETVNQINTNANKYNSSTNQAEKDALFSENAALVYGIGGVMSPSGNYYDRNTLEKLYFNEMDAAAQDLSSSNKTVDMGKDYAQVIVDLIGSGSAGNSAEVSQAAIDRATKIVNMGSSGTQHSASYNTNVDYAAAIQTAKAQGASQAVIDELTAAREAKIADMNK